MNESTDGLPEQVETTTKIKDWVSESFREDWVNESFRELEQSYIRWLTQDLTVPRYTRGLQATQ